MKPGYAFGEHIRTEKIPHHRYGDEKKPMNSRGYLLPGILLLVFLFLFVKLLYLQFVQGNYYRRLGDFNRIRTQIVHAPRGIIFDRNGTPLVFNTPGFRQTIDEKTIHLEKDKA